MSNSWEIGADVSSEPREVSSMPLFMEIEKARNKKGGSEKIKEFLSDLLDDDQQLEKLDLILNAIDESPSSLVLSDNEVEVLEILNALKETGNQQDIKKIQEKLAKIL